MVYVLHTLYYLLHFIISHYLLLVYVTNNVILFLLLQVLNFMNLCILFFAIVIIYTPLLVYFVNPLMDICN